MKKILFIGPIDFNKAATGGAMVKNQHLLEFFQASFVDVKFVDTVKYKSNPFILINIFIKVILAKNRKIIFSTSSGSTYLLVRILIALKIKRQIIYWVLGGDLGKILLEKKMDATKFNYFDKIIVEGESIKNDLLECGLLNTLVVTNFKKINLIPEKKFNNEIKKFVFLSRIIPEKGVDLIFESIDKLNAKGLKGKFQVDFFGEIDDNYLTVFDKYISENSNVNYNGFLDLKVVSNYNILSAYDVMLFPTIFNGEGFPGIIIDAFIAGLPVIASDWNLNSEIVENMNTGFIIKSKNSDSLTEAMLKIIKGEVDLIEMSTNCQKMSINFDIDNVLNSKLLSNLGL